MHSQSDEPKQQSSLAPTETQNKAAAAVAKCIEQRMLRLNERFKPGEHADLRETLTKLQAYSEVLRVPDLQQFLQEELNRAAKQVNQIERRLDNQRQADLKQEGGLSMGR